MCTTASMSVDSGVDT